MCIGGLLGVLCTALLKQKCFKLCIRWDRGAIPHPKYKEIKK